MKAAAAHRIVAQRRNNFAPTRPSESPTTTCTCGPTADVAAHGSVTRCSVVRAAFVRVALERSAAFDESEDSVHPAIDRAYRTRLAGHSDAYVRRRHRSSAGADPDELIAGPSGCVHCFQVGAGRDFSQQTRFRRQLGVSALRGTGRVFHQLVGLSAVVTRQAKPPTARGGRDRFRPPR